jgi:sensor c-di-GMP phosphodiesterase-like protein
LRTKRADSKEVRDQGPGRGRKRTAAFRVHDRTSIGANFFCVAQFRQTKTATARVAASVDSFGRADGDRTDDLLSAIQALSQAELRPHIREGSAAVKNRDVGVSIAIYDFGSSYSSLGSLRVLPINAVKMDRSLLASVATAEADASIVAAVIGVSRKLRLRVVADGVETREQFDFLENHGYHEAQGSYFSAAVDPERFTLLTSSGDKTHSSASRR